jgi:hypothetical protein
MAGLEQRRLVYISLFIACSAMAIAAGLKAGIWSFVQVGVMIELLGWLTGRRAPVSRPRL